MKKTILGLMLCSFLSFQSWGVEKFEKDTLKTNLGDLEITFIGHGSLLFKFQNKHIYIDPYSKLADYGSLPKANLIFITHEHSDHLDLTAINALKSTQTLMLVTAAVQEKIKEGTIIKNRETINKEGLKIEAIPAYNLVNKRPSGEPFHAKGTGNGLVLSFGNKRVYIAGDTENIPEMKALKKIDVAFLPMNLPYTMTPEMVADAAKAFKPKILYPYHYGETEVSKILELLKGEKEIEVRIRKMK